MEHTNHLPSLPFGIEQINKCIPHRYPFLLVDQVIELVPNESIVAIKQISVSDPILQGHFPGNPVYPGVLLVEAMAQTSAILGHYCLEKGHKSVLLTEVNNARFRRQVVPGDTLKITIKIEKSRSPFFWFKGEVTVGGEVAAKATLSALMK